MDFEKYVNSKLYNIFDWLYKVIFINILWFLISFFGLGIFTIMPALISAYLLMIHVVHKKDYPIFTTFMNVFKKEYIKSQKVFIILMFIGFALFTSIRYYYLNLSANGFNLIAFYMMITLTLVYIMTCLHVIPVYIHFPHLKPLKVLKYSFIFSFLFPIQTFLLLLTHGVMILLFISINFFFSLIPFIFISFIFYISYIIVGNKYSKLLNATQDNVLSIDRYHQ